MSELADFVLDAFRQAGGIIEPPAYGVYEALLPEDVARRWDVPAYRRLAFAGESPTEVSDEDDVTIVGYGHPLVETLVEDVRAEPACVQLYVNDLRLDKRGLLALAHKTLTFPNARLTEAPRKSRKASLCHYVRFNFKAALITDEKRERLVSVVMDAQGGFAVPELTHIERLARLDEKTTFAHLTPAPVRWLPGAGHKDGALSRPVLEGLLERATHAALDELAEPLGKLRRRAARYLELDRARLNGYYDDIARDLPIIQAKAESILDAVQSGDIPYAEGMVLYREARDTIGRISAEYDSIRNDGASKADTIWGVLLSIVTSLTGVRLWRGRGHGYLDNVHPAGVKPK